VKCYVQSTLLYGCDSWTVIQRMKSQLEATEMWFLRHMLKFIVNRQIQVVGHIVRKSQLKDIALTGMIEGKRARDRQRKTFMDWLSFACEEQCKMNDILKIYQDCNEHILIANVRV